MNGRGTATLAAAGAAMLLLLLQPPRGLLHAQGTDAGCRACHPGPTRGLRGSPHGVLLDRPDTEARACSACHGDLSAHADAMARPGEREPVAVPRVDAASCAQCHPDAGYAPAQGAHPLVPQAPPMAAGPVVDPDPDAALRAALAQRERGAGFRWSGLLEFGQRIAHVAGSRDRYESDVDLEPGFRLRAFELTGAGEPDAFADELSLRAHDLGDPRWDVGGRAGKDRAWSVGAEHRRDRFLYASSGDFHRVDRSSGATRTDAEVWLSDDVSLFGGFTRRSEDGFWLTRRIGNRNLGVQTVVDGVRSPRRFDGDTMELGLRGDVDGLRFVIAADYLDDRSLDRWSYTRPAQADPTFPESEDFTSRASLRGPGGRMALGRTWGPLAVDLDGRYVQRDRRIVGAGTGAGYDIDQFTSTTTALGDGDTRTFLGDATASLELSDGLALVGDLRWRDHREELELRQFDVITYPLLATTTTVATLAAPDTSQRLLEGTLALDWSPHAALDLSLGYGFAREWLRVPDLEAGDADFRRGLARDDGVLASATWRLDGHWTLQGELRDFGQDGVLLHELAPESSRQAAGSLGWRDGSWHGTAFVRHRRNENDTSRHRTETFTTGVTGGLQRGGLGLQGGYTFARIDSRTLTNFYFDPDPSPRPTFVGFRGDTQTVTGTLTAEPSADVRWQFGAAWTTTTGDFDVTLLDWHADLRWLVRPPGGSLGLEFRQLRYDDQDGRDDWGAELVFLYWRQVW